MTSVRIIGAGRAGGSFANALGAIGVDVLPLLRRGDDLSHATDGVDLVLIAAPDHAVEAVASSLEPRPSVVVLHLSGALGLSVLAGHARRGSLHPLATLPDPVIGGVRLRGGAYFAVAGDPVATDLALALGGHPIVVAEEARAAYHAAATIAANHLVALLGQVERVAANAGLPLEAFLPLARGALDDVRLLGPRRALTGPAARGDDQTLARHRGALDPAELDSYDALVALAMRLRYSAERDPADAETAGADMGGVPAQWS